MEYWPNTDRGADPMIKIPCARRRHGSDVGMPSATVPWHGLALMHMVDPAMALVGFPSKPRAMDASSPSQGLSTTWLRLRGLERAVLRAGGATDSKRVTANKGECRSLRC
jgi:hypothetical protein